MSGRYRLTELRPNGYGRRVITERLAVARDVIDALGGEWRVERQWLWNDHRWHRDGGNAVWTEGTPRLSSPPDPEEPRG